MIAESRSGRSFISLSLMAFQPAMDEPSNMVPSVRKSSSTRSMSKVTCCIFPRISVKRTSTYLTSFSLIRFWMSLAEAIGLIPFSRTLDGRWPGFAGADAHHLQDVGDEDLAVADAPGPGGGGDGLDGA